MKRYLFLFAAVISFAACESSDEQPNPFEGMPTEEIVAQEGGIDYLIEISEPVDQNILVDLLQSNKVLEISQLGYDFQNGHWKSVPVFGSTLFSCLLLLDENTYRSCWVNNAEALYLNGQFVEKVYRDYAHNNDLSGHIWNWLFHQPTNVKVEAYVDDLIFVTCTNGWGHLEGELLRVRDDRELIMTEYCNNLLDCTSDPTK